MKDTVNSGRALLGFPLKSGEVFNLTEDKLSEYRKTFPALDVLAELRRARQWLLDNPGRRKTARGMARFLGGWLSRVKPDGDRVPRAALDAVCPLVEPPDEVFQDD